MTLTLNRPDKLNAFNGPMMNELLEAFDAADADDDVRAIIVTGAGRAFCAGADLSAGAKTFDYEKRDDRPDKQGVPRDAQAASTGATTACAMAAVASPCASTNA